MEEQSKDTWRARAIENLEGLGYWKQRAERAEATLNRISGKTLQANVDHVLRAERAEAERDKAYRVQAMRCEMQEAERALADELAHALMQFRGDRCSDEALAKWEEARRTPTPQSPLKGATPQTRGVGVRRH